MSSGCPGSATPDDGGSTNSDGGAGGLDGGGPGDPGPRPLTLLAGQIGGRGNLDGRGAEARLYQPSGLANDGAGNLYIADSENHTIRRVALATGDVTTLAGLPGTFGTVDGIGRLALLFRPRGLALDGAGNLWFTDGGTSVRKLALATNQVTTVAGGLSGSADGTGTAASFFGAEGLAWDGAGSLYVADANNSLIRKLVVATGVVTTVAGAAGMTGSTDASGAMARFYLPRGVAMDGNGNLYVADSGNATLRRVVVATRAVTTPVGVAGMPGTMDGMGTAARLGMPVGLSLDGVGNLYIADNNNVIRRVVLGTLAVTTLAGAVSPGSTDGTGTAARFNFPEGIAWDGMGGLLVTDFYGHLLRRVVAATGVVTTVAGRPARPFGSADGSGPAARFSTMQAMASDANGNIYLVDGNTIRKAVLATGQVTTVAGDGAPGSTDGVGPAARFIAPGGLAGDGAGNLYIADSGNHTIRKMALATMQVTTIAGLAGAMGATDGMGMAARFNQMFGLAYIAPSSLYVADYLNNTLRHLDTATGQVSTVVGMAGMAANTDGVGTAARLYTPRGIAVVGNDLYISDFSTARLRRVTLPGYQVTTVAGMLGVGALDGPAAAARFRQLDALSYDGSGSLYIVDFGNNAVRKLAIATGIVSTVFGTSGAYGVRLGQPPTTLSRPWGLVALPSGEVILGDSAEGSLMRSP